MKTKIRNAPPVASTDLLAVAPPSRINGKLNPEYTRWYRKQKPESYQVYNASEKAKACRKKYKAKDLERKRDRNEVIKQDQCKCVECGMVFDALTAALEGFRHLRRNRYMGICNSCG